MIGGYVIIKNELFEPMLKADNETAIIIPGVYDAIAAIFNTGKPAITERATSQSGMIVSPFYVDIISEAGVYVLSVSAGTFIVGNDDSVFVRLI